MSWTVAHRRMVVLAYLVVTGAVVVGVGGRLGRELFPRVDTGQFQLRVRPPQGTHYELTRQVAQKTLDVIAEEAGPDNVDITMGYAGANPPQFTINMAYLWSRGPDDSLLRDRPARGEQGRHLRAPGAAARRPCRRRWARGSATSCCGSGLTAEQADQRVADLVFAFEPGDLISETMSLGAPAPIEVVVSGRNLADSSTFMDRLRERVRRDRVAPRRPDPAVAPLPDRPGRPSTASGPA